MSKREDNETRKLASVKAREKFLDENSFNNNIAEHTQDEALLVALSSQARWAKYVRDDFISMSLNTLKATANKYLLDGYAGLDDKRVQALVLIQEHLNQGKSPQRSTRPDTKQGLKIKSKTKDLQLSILREANLALSKGLEITIDALDKLAEESKDSYFRDVVEREMSKVRALLRKSFQLGELDNSVEGE
jgi:hypothetical protein